MKTKARMRMPKEKDGEGHQAHFSVQLKSTFEIDGKKQSFNLDYDLTVKFEQIDYIVRQIAGGIAQAASDIAENGIKSREPAENAVA